MAVTKQSSGLANLLFDKFQKAWEIPLGDDINLIFGLFAAHEGRTSILNVSHIGQDPFCFEGDR
jgi:hypothetical protein